MGRAFLAGVIGGVVMSLLMHPLMPQPMMPPGAFMSKLGAMGIGAEIMLHLIYGATVGAIYGPVRHLAVQRPATT